jgi:hypothetical protein
LRFFPVVDWRGRAYPDRSVDGRAPSTLITRRRIDKQIGRDSPLTIRDVIERHGHFAHGGNPEDAAETWTATGFEAHEVDEWLRARCYDPGAARDLADAGVSPEMAQMKTSAGAGDYTDTVGFKVSTGDIEVDEARELAGVY